MDLVERDSQTAKDGFKNEIDIKCDNFKHYKYELNNYIYTLNFIFSDNLESDITSVKSYKIEFLLIQNSSKVILMQTRVLLEFYMLKTDNNKNRIYAEDFIKNKCEWQGIRKRILGIDHKDIKDKIKTINSRLLHLLNNRDEYDYIIKEDVIYLINKCLELSQEFLSILKRENICTYDDKFLQIDKSLISNVEKFKNNLFRNSF